MNKIFLRKTIIFGIILLFLGAGIVSGIKISFRDFIRL